MLESHVLRPHTHTHACIQRGAASAREAGWGRAYLVTHSAVLKVVVGKVQAIEAWRRLGRKAGSAARWAFWQPELMRKGGGEEAVSDLCWW
jgi:hypothetical protein